MPPTPATQRVPRKVYFYRVEVLTGPDEEPQAFTAREACDCISNLSFETGARYLDLGEDGLFCVWPDATGRYMRMALGVVRRSGLPFLEAHGDVLPLEIAEEQGILERTHAVFFPNDTVAAEYNFYGPRASRLAPYIRANCE